MAKLEILNSKLKGREIGMKEHLSLGSSKGCTVRVKHEKIRDIHAIFTTSDTGVAEVEVADRDAHIFINGKDIMKHRLKHGDKIKIGPLLLRYIDPNTASAADIRLDELMSEYESNLGSTLYDFSKDDLFYLTSKNPELKEAISFTLPSKDRFIDQAQAFLSRLTSQANMDEMKHEAFMTCTKELILNAHRHGHEYDESKTITIRYRDHGDAISLRITDEGTGFDHETAIAAVNDVNATDAARARYMAGGFGGLGFQMIVRMSDKLEYNESGSEVFFKISKQM